MQMQNGEQQGTTTYPHIPEAQAEEDNNCVESNMQAKGSTKSREETELQKPYFTLWESTRGCMETRKVKNPSFSSAMPTLNGEYTKLHRCVCVCASASTEDSETSACERICEEIGAEKISN